MIGALAHNLVRWMGVLGLPGRRLAAPAAMRRRLLALPGRITSGARRRVLHLPARWPLRLAFSEALSRIRALAPA